MDYRPKGDRQKGELALLLCIIICICTRPFAANIYVSITRPFADLPFAVNVDTDVCLSIFKKKSPCIHLENKQNAKCTDYLFRIKS